MFELLGIALAPGFAIMLYIYLKDKHEREPVLLLFLSFIYGIFSTFITLGISFPLEKFLALKDDDVLHQFYDAFFKVALVEEFSKFLFVRFILYPNKNFNEPFDGIVYAVMVSMGFATFENVIYVYSYGIETGILRMFTAVPAHATFGVIMGYFLGIGKFRKFHRFYFSLFALMGATFFHGAYDYFWFIADATGVWTGIWMGAIVSLIVGLILSRKAIRLHQQASPFIEPVIASDEKPAAGEP
ncbi:MAG TPA: PrsW family glutamic-type intramembrane protease [Chryseosolibacter sp.]